MQVRIKKDLGGLEFPVHQGFFSLEAIFKDLKSREKASVYVLPCYLAVILITPQAIFSPEFPEGCVVKSSGLA